MMKRKFAFIIALLSLCLSLSWLVACVPPTAELISNVADVTKGYFVDDESASTTKINLADYISKNGADVTYQATAENPSVAEVTIDDDVLSARVLTGAGSTKITVNVNSNGKFSFAISFRLTATVYDSIVCVGDSLTYGHKWHSQSYPVYLQTKLGSGITVTNCGKNGASITGYGGSEIKYTTLSEYTNSLNANPDVVVLMLGTNDATGWAHASSTFESEYRQLIANYKAYNPNVKIIIVTSPPTQDGNYFQIPNDVIKAQVNPIQRRVASELNLPLIDARNAFETRAGGYASLLRTENNDGVHFSVLGAEFVADLVCACIKSL